MVTQMHMLSFHATRLNSVKMSNIIYLREAGQMNDFARTRCAQQFGIMHCHRFGSLVAASMEFVLLRHIACTVALRADHLREKCGENHSLHGCSCSVSNGGFDGLLLRIVICFTVHFASLRSAMSSGVMDAWSPPLSIASSERPRLSFSHNGEHFCSASGSKQMLAAIDDMFPQNEIDSWSMRINLLEEHLFATIPSLIKKDACCSHSVQSKC
jgi:hypothetical protein